MWAVRQHPKSYCARSTSFDFRVLGYAYKLHSEEKLQVELFYADIITRDHGEILPTENWWRLRSCFGWMLGPHALSNNLGFRCLGGQRLSYVTVPVMPMYKHTGFNGETRPSDAGPQVVETKILSRMCSYIIAQQSREDSHPLETQYAILQATRHHSRQIFPKWAVKFSHIMQSCNLTKPTGRFS